jgi:N-glycosidase YbiA
MNKPIKEFRGVYRWLSNFYTCSVIFDSAMYRSAEAAYQAAKTLDHKQRIPFMHYEALEAKRAGRLLILRPDWELVKLGIMERIVQEKFKNPELAGKLLATEHAQLIEGNLWHDQYWGQCFCAKHKGEGENHLGKILMRERLNTFFHAVDVGYR